MSEQTKEDYVVDFIKAFKAIEDEMEPFKEHKRDLRKNYVQNGWLSKEEMSSAIRAYRMLKNDEDIEQLLDMYEKVAKVPY